MRFLLPLPVIWARWSKIKSQTIFWHLILPVGLGLEKHKINVKTFQANLCLLSFLTKTAGENFIIFQFKHNKFEICLHNDISSGN